MAEVLARLQASPARRYFGVGTMVALGLLLIYLALSQSYASLGWQLLLLALGGGALYAAMRMLQATALHLELRPEGLFDSEGHRLTGFDEIVSIERGMLAMKPSNGFMIVTRSRQPRRWRPGLYWVMGKRIGVGGVTPAADAKYLADLMNMTLVDRRGGV